MSDFEKPPAIEIKINREAMISSLADFEICTRSGSVVPFPSIPSAIDTTTIDFEKTYLMMLMENVLFRIVKKIPELERAMMELMEEHNLNSIIEPNKDKPDEVDTDEVVMSKDEISNNEYHEHVQRFADLMEKVLIKHSDRGKSWMNMSFAELFARLVEEVGEVAGLLINLEDKDQVMSQLADVANFCMMISEKFET